MAKLILSVRILLCVALVCATFEVLTRVDDHFREGASFFGPFDTGLLLGQDELGRYMLPNSHFARWKINASGYRGPEPRSGTIRIICLGASETFGITEDDNREYPRQLEEQLNKRLGTRSIEVINLGLIGSGFHETPGRIPQIVERYHPDFVVIYPSPAQYIYQEKPSPARAPAPSRPVVPSPPPSLRSRIQGTVYRQVQSRTPWVFKRIWRAWLRMRLGDFRVMGRLDGITARHFPPPVVAWWRHWFANYRAWRQGIPLMDRMPEEKVEIFRADLTSILNLLGERGVPVVLATHATRFGNLVVPEERKTLILWRAYYPVLKEDGFLDMNRRLNQVIQEVGAADGARVADAAQLVPPGPRYFADFIHFTNQGSEQMSTLLADELEPMVKAKLQARATTRVPSAKGHFAR